LEEGVSDCDLLVQDTEDFMWLYARHKQADSGIVKAHQRRAIEMTTQELCGYFGMDCERVSEYQAIAAHYSYVIHKKSMKGRMALQREKLRLQREAPGDSDHIQRVEADLARLSADFMGERELAPIGKRITEDGVVFDSLRDGGVDESVRVVVYDYVDSEYSLIELVPQGETLVVPREFFRHREYKWKMQTMRDGKWRDLTRYAAFAFPDQVINAGKGQK
jgi:hypothetical protein